MSSPSIDKVIGNAYTDLSTFKEQLSKKPKAISPANQENLVRSIMSTKEAMKRIRSTKTRKSLVDSGTVQQTITLINGILKESSAHMQAGQMQAIFHALADYKSFLEKFESEEERKASLKKVKGVDLEKL